MKLDELIIQNIIDNLEEIQELLIINELNHNENDQYYSHYLNLLNSIDVLKRSVQNETK